jgi:iron complex outermembrane receptor protein
MKFLIFLLIPFFGIGQSRTISVTVNKTGVDCNSDNSKSTIYINKLEGENYITFDSVLITGCYGMLSIPKQVGKFQIIFSSEGYYPETIPFQTTEQTPDSISITRTLIKSNQLTQVQEVTITGIKRDMIRMEANRVLIQVKDNEILTISNLYDALIKIPGAFLTPNGDITYKGKDASVYFDGMPSNLSGPTLTSYLKSLPASSVERIEIIPNPGAAYDANLQGAIIDVITRGNSPKWISGTINLNYGRNLNDKLSPSIVLNGRQKKVSWHLLTGLNITESSFENNSTKEFTYFTPLKKYRSNIALQDLSRSTYVKPSFSVRLNKKSYFLMNYQYYYSNSMGRFGSDNENSTLSYRNSSDSPSSRHAHEAAVKYHLNIDTLERKLEITSFSSYSNTANQMNASQNENDSRSYSKYNFNPISHVSYAKFDFTLPFKRVNFNTGGKVNVENSSNRGRYFLGSVTDALFYNNNYQTQIDFAYTEKNAAIYVEGQKNIGKFDLGAGLRYENFTVDRTSSLFVSTLSSKLSNLFPNAYATYQFNPSIYTSLSYSKKISIPSATLFDPNNSNFYDKYFANKGNIYLQPNIYNNVNFTFSAFDYLQFSVDYTQSKNENITIFETEPNSIVVTQTNVNFTKVETLSIFGSLPIPFGIFMEGLKYFSKPINPNEINYLYLWSNTNFFAMNGNGIQMGFKPIWSHGLMSHFVLPRRIKLNVNYNITTKGYYQLYYVEKPIHYAEFVISKDFFKNKLTTSLSITDPFNTNETNVVVQNTNLNFHTRSKNDTRVVRINLSYSFGRYKNLMNENTKIETDKKANNKGLF